MLPQKKPKKGAPGWIVSFADLQQLLLVFFILLFSMSSVDSAKFQEAMQSIQITLDGSNIGFLDGGEMVNKENGSSQNNKDFNEQSKVESVAEKKEQQLKEELLEAQNYLKNNEINGEKLDEYMTAIKTSEGIVLRINDVLLFDSGSAEIKENAAKVLLKMTDLIKANNRAIRVEGHTDNVPIRNSRFASNWELSTARATKVVAFLLEHNMVLPEKLSASGYGEFKPVAPNDTAQNKSKNRRVDIVLLSDFSNIEKQSN